MREFRRRRFLALWPILALAGVALTFWYLKMRTPTVRLPHTEQIQAAIPALITTARPSRRSFTLSIPWIGEVETQASVELIALRSARVKAIEIEDQTWVTMGRLVVRLGGPQVDGLRGKLSINTDALTAQLKLSGQIIERLNRSMELQMATREQVAAAEDAHIKLKAQSDKARLEIETFENQVDIRAPLEGVFTNRRVSVGQDVNAGQVIGEIIDTHHLRIVAAVFPSSDSTLRGAEATIRLDDNRTVTGFVRQVLPRAGNTGAVMVWIESPQIDGQLHPGQTVGGSMEVETVSDSIAVPESAIIYDSEERPYLFILKDGTYKSCSVKLGLLQNGWIEVLSGLAENQTVVTKGGYELFYSRFNEQFKVQD